MFERIKNFIYAPYEYDDFEEDYYYNDNESEVIGNVIHLAAGEKPPKRDYKKINEEERKHCIELFRRATAFNELDAAAVMAALVQVHPAICFDAIQDYAMGLEETVRKYENIGRE